jgi:hypothetical protein
MEAARLDPKRQEYLRETALALHEHGRREEALLFARRVVHLDPSPQNQQVLNLVLGHPEKPTVPPAEMKAKSASESSDGHPRTARRRRSGLLARLFRRRS